MPLKPSEYPSSAYYYNNEKDSEWWVKAIEAIFKHNKDCFFILYGGEPFLKYDTLVSVVKYLNSVNGPYTIISNGTDAIKDKIEKLVEEVGVIAGFTCSIDPSILVPNREGPDVIKSRKGLELLKDLINRGLVKDPVAEITCDNESIEYLYDLVKMLSELKIYSDITVIDQAKNNYYDFSNVIDSTSLVTKEQAIKVFEKLNNDNLLIHMKETLLDLILKSLPTEVDCELDKVGVHNVTIDSDGALRLCLRIRGRYTPKYTIFDLLNEEKEDEVFEAIKADKESLCQKCNWTCMLMSKAGTSEEIIDHKKSE